MAKKRAASGATVGTRKRKRGKPPKGWQRVFLRALAKRPFVQTACRTARVGRETAYRWRKKSPKFAAAWDSALSGAVELFEASCFDWAMKGIDSPITYKGAITAKKLDRSQYLAGIFLRAFNPDRYADPKVNIGSNASPVDTAMQLRMAIEAMMRATAVPPPTPEPPPGAAPTNIEAPT